MARIWWWSPPLPDAGNLRAAVSRWWPGLDLSNLLGRSFPWWRLGSLLEYFSVVDSVVWSFVVAAESVYLVSMLCFFFLFCGCSI